MSQNDKILQYLKAGGELTPLDALKMFGCFRLSGRIYDLKEDGHHIAAERVKRGGKWVALYRMERRRKAA